MKKGVIVKKNNLEEKFKIVNKDEDNNNDDNNDDDISDEDISMDCSPKEVKVKIGKKTIIDPVKNIPDDIKNQVKLIFKEGITHVNSAELFNLLHPNKYIYDENRKNSFWYYINEFGIYKQMGGDSGLIKNIQLMRQVIDPVYNELVKIYDIFLKFSEGDEEDEQVLKQKMDNKKAKKELKKKYDKCFDYLNSALRSADIVKQLRITYKQDDVNDKFNVVNPYLFAFNNGVYDLENDIFRNAKPEEYILLTTGYDYKEIDDKIKQEILKDLRDVISDEDELTFLLKVFAMSLMGSTKSKIREEKFYIWKGTGGNGKSFISGIVENAFGGYYKSLDVQNLLYNKLNKSNGKGPDQAIADKKYTRVCVSHEAPQGSLIDSGKVKVFSGGDSVQTRGMYAENMTNFKPNFTLHIQTNYPMHIDGTDDGMVRRLVVIPFKNKFVDKNPDKSKNEKLKDLTLKNKYDTDDKNIYRNGFIQILIHYYKLFMKEGFKIPLSIQKETKNYIGDFDPVQSFIDSELEITKNYKDKIDIKTLLAHFNVFTDEKINKQSDFKEILEKKKFTCVKSSIFYVHYIKFKPKKTDFDNDKEIIKYKSQIDKLQQQINELNDKIDDRIKDIQINNRIQDMNNH